MEPYLDPNDRFRQRRAQSRRRQRLRRTVGAIALLLAAAAVAVGAGALPERGDDTSAEPVAAKRKAATPPKRTGPPVPKEIRGVHVTMALASLDGKLAEYTRIPGINTIQLDVKDENGEVAFHRLAPTLAKHVGSAMRYYDPVKAAKQVHSEGLFLIGRVVCFEDPILSKRRPDLAIRTSGGAVWQNDAGLGWTNPYEKRVWDYNIDSAVFPGRRNEAMGVTIARFVHYATKRLSPMGVRVSVDVFGLSATRDLGIGQSPRRLSKIVDAIYPMVYPSHYGPGEYGLANPVSVPGRTVGRSLRDFRRQMRRGKAELVPWLEDFTFNGTTTR